jgi:hypothetical protein
VARDERIDVIEADAAAYQVEPEAFDATLRLGATFVWQGLELVALVASCEDDWDRYESLHRQAVEAWAALTSPTPTGRRSSPRTG